MRFILNFAAKYKINLKYTLILVSVALATGLAILIFSKIFVPGEFTIPLPEVKNLAANSKKDSENIKPLYYYYSQANEPDMFRVIKLDTDISSENIVTVELEGHFSVIGKFSEEGKFFVTSEESPNKLSVLNPENGELKEFFVVEEKKEFISAIFSPDKKFLAFSLVSGDYAKAAGEVWILDLEKKERKKIFEKNRLLLYSELKVLGWKDGNGKIIIQEIGNDALVVWGKIYLVDTKNGGEEKSEQDTNHLNSYKEVEIKASEADSFLRGQLSPDGKKWLYISCKNPTPEDDYDYSSCEEGAEILVYSFEEASSLSLYRNLTNINNPFKKKLRVINSAIWLDSDNIIFTIPDGIYKVNLGSKEAAELHEFKWTDPDDIFKSPSKIIYADDDVIIYARQNFNAGNFILNLKTKKTIEIEDENFTIDGFLK